MRLHVIIGSVKRGGVPRVSPLVEERGQKKHLGAFKFGFFLYVIAHGEPVKFRKRHVHYQKVRPPRLHRLDGLHAVKHLYHFGADILYKAFHCIAKRGVLVRDDNPDFLSGHLPRLSVNRLPVIYRKKSNVKIVVIARSFTPKQSHLYNIGIASRSLP